MLDGRRPGQHGQRIVWCDPGDEGVALTGRWPRAGRGLVRRPFGRHEYRWISNGQPTPLCQDGGGGARPARDAADAASAGPRTFD